MTESTSPAKKPAFIAYQVRDNKAQDAKSKGFWNRIGAAWSNKDGGLTLILESVPLDGRIVLQVPKEKDETEGQAE